MSIESQPTNEQLESPAHDIVATIVARGNLRDRTDNLTPAELRGVVEQTAEAATAASVDPLEAFEQLGEKLPAARGIAAEIKRRRIIDGVHKRFADKLPSVMASARLLRG